MQKYDSITGRTTGASSNGTFVETSTGVTGWIPKIFLPKNSQVMCSVSGVKEDGFIFLVLDSVIYPEVA